MTFEIKDQYGIAHKYINVVQDFKSPVNIFFDIDDLLNIESKIIYFFAYTIGKIRNVVWGVYDKINEKFIFDNGCKYNSKQLYGFIKYWKSKNFAYSGNVVKNKITKRIESEYMIPLKDYLKYLNVYLYLDDKITLSEAGENNVKKYQDYPEVYSIPNEKVKLSKKDYLKYKEIIAFFDGKIKKDDINEDVIDNFIKDVENFYSINQDNIELDTYIELYIRLLKISLSEYEKYINRIDLNEYLTKSIVENIKILIDKFYMEIKYGNIIYDNISKSCPNIDDCIKYNELCGVYYYGTEPDYLSVLDNRTMLA